jgi:hypothetical protein
MEDTLKVHLPTFLAASGVLIFIFLIGLFLQITIIKTVRKEQSITWDIKMTHSIVMIVHFCYTIIFEIATYLIPELGQYTGIWFCYVSLFLRMYGVSEILCHSLFLSIYKYIIIVHTHSVRAFGQTKLKKILFWINIVVPVFMSLTYTFRPNYRAIKAINRCGLYQGISNANNVVAQKSLGNLWDRSVTCGFGAYGGNNKFEHFADIITRIFCIGQAIFSIVMGLNILEIFFYVRIFSYMKR